MPWPYHEKHLQNILNFLFEIEEDIPMEAADDWRDDLLRTEGWYHRQQLATALPLAYQNYCQHIELGLPLDAQGKKRNHVEHVRNVHWQHILRGRELCGEPKNFEF